MADPTQVEKYRNDATLTLQNLNEVLAFLADRQEETVGIAVESLENCGAPTASHWPALSAALKSSHPVMVYWGGTLTGRLLETHCGSLSSDALRAIELELCQRLATESDLAAKERIVWAIGKLPAMDPATQRALESMTPSAPPRLKRLLEEALSSALSKDVA
jgi:hypothetical protein